MPQLMQHVPGFEEEVMHNEKKHTSFRKWESQRDPVSMTVNQPNACPGDF